MENEKQKTLDDIIKNYKPYEVDFVLPDPEGKDINVYIDLYLMYESKDPEWNEVQAYIYDYLDNLLKAYKENKISSNDILEKLYFPEVEEIGFGYCKIGTSGRGTHRERAILLRNTIFDNPNVKEFGIDTLANASIKIEGIGPDLLSDMAANFALNNLILYTQEQVKTFNLKTIEVPVRNAYNINTHTFEDIPKINLPVYENGDYRILVPRHISRKMPVFSTEAFYKNFLKYILQDEATSQNRIIKTIGKKPKVIIKKAKIKDLEKNLKSKYDSVSTATRNIAKDRPDLVNQYIKNVKRFSNKKRPRKEKINWSEYAKELKSIPAGNKNASKYAETIRKIFNAIYSDNLLRGVLEKKSFGEIYRYDITFVNASITKLFRFISNQQLKAGVLIVEAKNYRKTIVGNKEFNQGLAYTMQDGRDIVFLVKRSNITEEDMNRSKEIYLRHRKVILPISDTDIIKMLEERKDFPDSFDDILIPRLQDILSS